MSNSMKGKPMTKKSKEPRIAITVRVPESVADRIRWIADTDGVSANSLIIKALKRIKP